MYTYILGSASKDFRGFEAAVFCKSKDKIPEVLFHRITLSCSYFEEFEFLNQFSKKQNMIKKKYQLNRNEKFVEKAKENFAFLKIKPKFISADIEKFTNFTILIVHLHLNGNKAIAIKKNASKPQNSLISPSIRYI